MGKTPINDKEKKMNTIKNLCKEKLIKLNNESPFDDISALERLARDCDEGSENQDLTTSSSLYLYAYFNGSTFAENRLRQMGIEPFYFKQIVEVTETLKTNDVQIMNTIKIGTRNLIKGDSLREVITKYYLFVNIIRNIGLILINNYHDGIEYILGVLLLHTAADSSVEDDVAALYVGNYYFGCREYETSYEYFLKSANKGNAEAIYSLSGFYYNGIGGVTKDLEMVTKLLYKAASLGNQRAKDKIKIMGL